MFGYFRKRSDIFRICLPGICRMAKKHYLYLRNETDDASVFSYSSDFVVFGLRGRFGAGRTGHRARGGRPGRELDHRAAAGRRRVHVGGDHLRPDALRHVFLPLFRRQRRTARLADDDPLPDPRRQRPGLDRHGERCRRLRSRAGTVPAHRRPHCRRPGEDHHPDFAGDDAAHRGRRRRRGRPFVAGVPLHRRGKSEQHTCDHDRCRG